jgi:ubiquinone/menaquinone biosynthesis C-methylase UbiE
VTLERVLEPEAMDSPEDVREYDDMDHSEANRAFVDDLLAANDAPGDVLDVGTGTALIPIELCERCEDCRVMAADLSVHMLDSARYNIEVAGLIDRIQLEHLDAKKLPSPNDYFHTVISNGALHHLADPLPAMREAARVVVPGGMIFFRDLARPESDAAVQTIVETYAGDADDRQQEMLEASLRASLPVNEMRALLEQLGFDPSDVEATSDRHWTWCSRKPQVESP